MCLVKRTLLLLIGYQANIINQTEIQAPNYNFLKQKQALYAFTLFLANK